MSYKHISPAGEWFYVQIATEHDRHTVVYPVAVWATNDEGEVIGLISVAGGGPDDKIMGRVCRLVAPPPLRGVYKHLAELDANENRSFKEKKPILVDQ